MDRSIRTIILNGIAVVDLLSKIGVPIAHFTVSTIVITSPSVGELDSSGTPEVVEVSYVMVVRLA